MLEVRGLEAWYGHTQALFGVDLDVVEGETLALVGVNGTGKTTTVQSIAGHVRTSGQIKLDGEPIQSAKPFQRARAGIGLVPETRDLFWEMSVRENLTLGLGPGGSGRFDEVLEVFPALKGRLDSRASDLSGGEQQMVAIARAIIRRPRLLMLDEPSLGLAPKVVEDVYRQLEILKQGGLTILLVEQSIALAKQFADRLTLMRNGRVVRTLDASDQEAISQLADEALGASSREDGDTVEAEVQP